jgi:HPt (histidine-containing phosphotransfer) domain-containing protein
MDPDRTHEISAALERLWSRFLPENCARVEILEAAARAVALGSLTSADREAAASAAHKLAGTLGTFQLMRGTELARELEQIYTHLNELDAAVAGPQTEQRIADMTAELRSMIESRSNSSQR